MSMTFSGWIPMRRGLLGHLQEGRLTPQEFIVLNILLLWADHRTGIATTNAAGIVFLSGRQLDHSVVQKKLASLVKKGYIKMPLFVKGQRGDYKIFIDKFHTVNVTEKGAEHSRLSFADTTDWEHPSYIVVGERTTVGTTERTGDGTDVTADSNNNRQPNNVEERSKTEDPRTTSSREEDASVVGKTQNPNPNAQLPYNLLSAEDKAKQGKLIADSLALQANWLHLVKSASAEGQITNVSSFDWLPPVLKDVRSLLNSTQDSVEQILAVTKWGVEVSSHWFTDNKNGKGKIADFAGFARSYPVMLRQYNIYNKKAEGATV